MRKLSRFLLYHPLLNPIRLAAWNGLARVLAARNLAIVSAGNEPELQDFYALLNETRRKVSVVLRDSEAYNVYSATIQTAKIPGPIAEVGVFQGGSARLICAVKGDRDLHLFDTFEGLPAPSQFDPKFKSGSFAASQSQVQSLLSGFCNLHFHKGLFPASAAGMEHLRFSFVHIDVDLYKSTRACLDWFYPRLNHGGLLISHDYREVEGVRKAFQEFFSDKPECLIELSGTQIAFVKIQ
jgi:O-methyltransferase